MQRVYFKTDTSGPVGLFCTADGRIDCFLLGEEFRFKPTSIKLNSFGFPKEGLKSEHKWEQIRDSFKEDQLPAGAKDDPVVVTGEAAVPAVSTGELPQAPQRLQSFVREAVQNYENLLPGKNDNESGKFLRVSGDPFGFIVKDPFLIWIRKCYWDLQKVFLEILATSRKRRFVILGTAGIGKSFTIFWVCYLATKGVKVVWKILPREIYILDFSPSKVASVFGPFSYLHDAAIRPVVEDLDAWLILDGSQPGSLTFPCHMLLACSAKKSNHAEFLKNPLAKKLFLPVWAEGELDQFCDDFSLYRDKYGAMDVPVKEEVLANFEELGGVPRYVLKNQEMAEGRDTFQNAVNQLTDILCWELLNGTFQEGLSDKIVHICVGNVEGKCNYYERVYTFASSRAQISVWEKLRSSTPQKIVSFMFNHWDDAMFGPVVGGFYEAASLEILRRGGTFKRKRVYEESSSQAWPRNLVLGKLDPSNFDDLKELENMKHLTCYKYLCFGYFCAYS